MTLTLDRCSYDGRAYRFTSARHVDGDGIDIPWPDGGHGPGVLEVCEGRDWRGNDAWKRADNAGYMASVVALKELLMQTVGTCPPLSDNTGKRKPKGK